MYSNLAMSLHTFPGTVRVGGGAEGSAALSSRESAEKKGVARALRSLANRTRSCRYIALSRIARNDAITR